MILKIFKGIKWKELKQWQVIYPEIGCKKNLENWGELNPCSQRDEWNSPHVQDIVFDYDA